MRSAEDLAALGAAKADELTVSREAANKIASRFFMAILLGKREFGRAVPPRLLRVKAGERKRAGQRQ